MGVTSEQWAMTVGTDGWIKSPKDHCIKHKQPLKLLLVMYQIQTLVAMSPSRNGTRLGGDEAREGNEALSRSLYQYKRVRRVRR